MSYLRYIVGLVHNYTMLHQVSETRDIASGRCSRGCIVILLEIFFSTGSRGLSHLFSLFGFCMDSIDFALTRSVQHHTAENFTLDKEV